MPTPAPFLTKSDFVAGRKCLKRLFLRKYQPALADPIDEAAKARMEDGSALGRFARLAFPNGILVAGDDPLGQTQTLLESADVLFEPQFISDGRTVRVDILKRLNDREWQVIEVKSSKAPEEKKKPKSEHLDDLAFQVMVLRDCGLAVAKACLMLVSRDYRCDGKAPDPSTFFTIVDVTPTIDSMIAETRREALEMIGVLGRETSPDVETNTFCKDCDFHGHCHLNQPYNDLVFLPRITAQKVDDLRALGARTIDQIPPDYPLNQEQRRVRETIRSGETFVSPDLAEILSSVVYPLRFIDFEATAYAMPQLEGTAPHEPIPFQWSCHMRGSPGAELVHTEFLYTGEGDPRPAFAESLRDDLGRTGTIFVYSSYEGSTLSRLENLGVCYGTELVNTLNERGMDLLRVVKGNVYMTRFRGSFSIKDVLPAMVSDLGYEDLAIRDGGTAASQFKKMVDPKTPRDESRRIATDLLAYCRRDTEAMVAIFDALGELCANQVVPEPACEGSCRLQLSLGI